MSHRQVGALLAAISRDEALKRRWNEARETAELVALAAELGYEVTAAELGRAMCSMAGDGELAEDQLDRVAGGWGGSRSGPPRDRGSSDASPFKWKI